MRIFKYLNIFIGVTLLLGCAARPARAQFIGYSSPQTVTQELAPAGTACTGSAQIYEVQNLGQTQHQFTITPNAGVTSMQGVVFGYDAAGNLFQISDTVYPTNSTASSILVASGAYPHIKIQIVCTGTDFELTYSGTSSIAYVNSGVQLRGQVGKPLANLMPANANYSTTLFTPFGSAGGVIDFSFQGGGAGPTGSTLTLDCQQQVGDTGTQVTFPLATAVGQQLFYVPNFACSNVIVQYVSGGASADTFVLQYNFWPGGSTGPVSAAGLRNPLNNSAALSEKGARWFVRNNPAAGNQATASKAAGANGVSHVADCVTFSAGSTTAPALTSLTVNLRDGATGAGTLIWSQEVVISATTGQNVQPFSVCGLNLIGTANTAMTLEFSASLANLIETVTLTGYDVQ